MLRDVSIYYCPLNPTTTPLTVRKTEVWYSAYHGQAPLSKNYWCPLKKTLVISGTSIFSDSQYTGRTSSLLVAVKGQNMPQNSKYSHPRLGLCRVRDGIFSGQPLLPLKRGLVFRQKPYYSTQKHV